MQQPRVPSGVPHPAVEDFLRNVLRSGLLDRGQLESALRAAPSEARASADALADFLVQQGKLSRFQAHKLRQGAARGLVLGPYQILAPLGRGGMGRVYLARDERKPQPLIALKVLPPQPPADEERRRARFRREMSLSRMLDHPHLAHSYEAGELQGVYYIAMEFIPGKNLARLVRDKGPLPLPRAARLFSEAALGLEYAHGRGLIHRDLKPSNIMVTPNDHAKVLDLGLAIMEGEEPGDRTVVGGQGYIVGTMDYLAPEQAEDAINVDARADVYGLGCSLYYALTGRPPFPGGRSSDKIRRHQTENPTPVYELNPAVPQQFQVVLDAMMAKRPDDRLPSMASVRGALQQWADEGAALPLDGQDDNAYKEAVAALENETASEMLPRDLLEMARARFAPGLARWYVLLPIGLGVLLLMGLLYLLLR